MLVYKSHQPWAVRKSGLSCDHRKWQDYLELQGGGGGDQKCRLREKSSQLIERNSISLQNWRQVIWPYLTRLWLVLRALLSLLGWRDSDTGSGQQMCGWHRWSQTGGCPGVVTHSAWISPDWVGWEVSAQSQRVNERTGMFTGWNSTCQGQGPVGGAFLVLQGHTSLSCPLLQEVLDVSASFLSHWNLFMGWAGVAFCPFLHGMCMPPVSCKKA